MAKSGRNAGFITLLRSKEVNCFILLSPLQDSHDLALNLVLPIMVFKW